MTVHLRASEDTALLPAAFEIGRHLEGVLEPLRQDDVPLFGADLDKALEAEGADVKPMRATLAYVHRDFTDEILETSVSAKVPGILGWQSLARLLYAKAREFIARYARDQTPPETYYTEIVVGTKGKVIPPRKPTPSLFDDVVARAQEFGVTLGKRGGRPKVVRRRKNGRTWYVDARTGKRSKRSAWDAFKRKRK
jgi:hypothetical protein